MKHPTVTGNIVLLYMCIHLSVPVGEFVASYIMAMCQTGHNCFNIQLLWWLKDFSQDVILHTRVYWRRNMEYHISRFSSFWIKTLSMNISTKIIYLEFLVTQKANWSISDYILCCNIWCSKMALSRNVRVHALHSCCLPAIELTLSGSLGQTCPTTHVLSIPAALTQ